MNNTIRFRSSGKQSRRTAEQQRNVAVTKIPESNILDLRSVATSASYAKTATQQVRESEAIPVTQPEPIEPTHATRSQNFLQGLLFRAEKPVVPRRTPKAQAPRVPVPAVLRQEPAPPPLESHTSVSSRVWARSLAGFAVFALILVLPVYAISQLEDVTTIQGRVLGASTDGYASLRLAQDAIGADRYTEAATAFENAERAFTKALDELESSGRTLSEILSLIPQVSSGEHLLNAGRELSRSGKALSTAMASLDAGSLTDVSFGRQIKTFSTHFSEAASALRTARSELELVDIEKLPESYRADIDRIATLIPELDDSLQRFEQSQRLLSTMLGVEAPQRYLMVFENNGEIRPTGGFIGSLALVDIDDGAIKNLEVPGGGSYDVAGQLREKVIAPTPLHLVNPHWNIQDANWFPDFPTSARKIMWFYERSGGPTVDGVIALTPAVLESFLRLTGPIAMDGYGVSVTDTNVVRLAQSFADKEEANETNTPKRFIADLLPILLQKVFTLPSDRFLELTTELTGAFTSKDILVYFSDTSASTSAHDLGWDGSIRSTSRDYLSVIHTNIGGGKTDRAIENLLRLTTEFDQDGTITNTLTITRKHLGDVRDAFENDANVDYVRIYVPSGSTLVSAEGFTRIPPFRFQTPDSEYTYDEDLQAIEGTPIIDESSGTRITNEFGKAVFGNWITVDPGETSTATITYTLPFRFQPQDRFTRSKGYGILVQKQPGVDQTAFVQTIIPASPLSILWKDDRIHEADGRLTITEELSTDRFFGFVARK